MSGFLSPGIVTGAEQLLPALAGPISELGPLATSLLAVIRVGRSIGSIIPDVVIEEQHSDHLEITTHPVANNTPISDHAFKQPATVTMRCGWTNANPLGGVMDSVGNTVNALLSGTFQAPSLSNPFGSIGNPLSSFTDTRARDVYTTLLALQTARTPFTLSTGKRYYPSMLIADLSVRTDRTSEYALMVDCHMQEIVLVSTQVTQGPALGNQANPQTTGSTTDSGVVQPQPNPDSLLKRGLAFFSSLGS